MTLVSGFLGSFGLWMFMRYVLGKDTTMDMASGIGVCSHHSFQRDGTALLRDGFDTALDGFDVMIVLINFLGYVYWKCRFKVGWFLLKRLGIDIFYEKPDPIKPGEFRVEAMDHTGKWNQFCYSGGSAGFQIPTEQGVARFTMANAFTRHFRRQR